MSDITSLLGEQWGRFEGDVVAKWQGDGRKMVLESDFAYVDPASRKWGAPKGSVIDGASIPRAFWTVIGGPFEGPYRQASVVHDVACAVRRREWRAVHRMFYNAMRCEGLPEKKATIMYAAVYQFGPRWAIPEEEDTGRFAALLPGWGRIPVPVPDYFLPTRDATPEQVRLLVQLVEDGTITSLGQIETMEWK